MGRTGPGAAFLRGLLLCVLAAALLRGCAVQRYSLTPLASRQPLFFPLDTRDFSLSSGYGWRMDPLTGRREFHEGVDLACAEGTPVLAVLAGVVTEAQRSSSYGNYLRLYHADGVETLYAHLQYLYVRPGEVVSAGQPLGAAGQTGQTTGPHLHFELWQEGSSCDPGEVLDLSEKLA